MPPKARHAARRTLQARGNSSLRGGLERAPEVPGPDRAPRGPGRADFAHLVARKLVPAVVLANGLVSILMKNLPDDRESVTMPLVVPANKPRLADLTIARDGE